MPVFSVIKISYSHPFPFILAAGTIVSSLECLGGLLARVVSLCPLLLLLIHVLHVTRMLSLKTCNGPCLFFLLKILQWLHIALGIKHVRSLTYTALVLHPPPASPALLPLCSHSSRSVSAFLSSLQTSVLLAALGPSSQGVLGTRSGFPSPIPSLLLSFFPSETFLDFFELVVNCSLCTRPVFFAVNRHRCLK